MSVFITRMNVVCSIQMLSLLIENQSYFDNDKSLYYSLINVLFKRSYLLIIGSPKDIESRSNTNPLWKKLWKGDGYNESNFIEWSDELFSDHPDALFLLDKNADECKIIRDTFGVACFGSEDISSSRYLFAHEKVSVCNSIKRVGLFTFDDFKRYQHPFSNIWIVDNYFPLPLNNGKNDEHPKAFFQVLQKLYGSYNKVNIHLYIIPRKNCSIEVNSINKEELKRWFEMVFPYGFKLILYKLCHNHDRNILTDYLAINSGVSLGTYTYKDETGLKSTDFSFLSLTGKANKSLSFIDESNNPKNDFSWGVESYNHIMNNIKVTKDDEILSIEA